jgi:iron(III) transport system ATP-binding protein
MTAVPAARAINVTVATGEASAPRAPAMVAAARTAAPAIELIGATRRFGNLRAVDCVSLAIAPGSVFALLGPSGCGKTTLLRLIAGFERPDAGSVLVDGQTVATPQRVMPPERRRIGIVFQDYALFPHLTVRQNIAYGLKRRLWQKRRRARIEDMLELVDLTAHAEKRPHQLSGGEQQRVALARALAPEPRTILLDEPFANLDATLRAEVRDQTRQILKRCGATAILVTHDQEEALSIADTVGVMLAGRIAQVGSPEEVYYTPATREVARLIGDGNLLEAHTEAGVIHCSLGKLDHCAGCGTLAPAGGLASQPAAVEGASLPPGEPCGRCEIFVRAEAIRLKPTEAGAPPCGRPEATVEETHFFGHDQAAVVRTAEGCRVRVRLGPGDRIRPGDLVRLSVDGPVIAYPQRGEK